MQLNMDGGHELTLTLLDTKHKVTGRMLKHSGDRGISEAEIMLDRTKVRSGFRKCPLTCVFCAGKRGTEAFLI